MPDIAEPSVCRFNDFLLDEWCATDPARLYGAAILPLPDIDATMAEIPVE
jgi:hypothetical protein